MHLHNPVFLLALRPFSLSPADIFKGHPSRVAIAITVESPTIIW